MRAAQYVRMSTEHQQYSIENQQTAIAQYAELHGFEIVRTYSDQARSGIDLAHRPGLRQLLQDIVAAKVIYQAILVFDVSRWGRFQDADESAFYEFFCKRAGARVHYCAESFTNDDTLASTLLKTVKRAMAGEYLRELSAKVSPGNVALPCQASRWAVVPGTVCGGICWIRTDIQSALWLMANGKACNPIALFMFRVPQKK